MICSHCGEYVSECAHCGHSFHVGDTIICYDTGVVYAHFCSSACLKADIIRHKAEATVMEEGD